MEAVTTRLKLGHTELNSMLHRIGSKHPTGKCRLCDHPESVQHVLMECKGYKRERRAALQREMMQRSLMQSIRRYVSKYFRETGYN